LVVDLFGSATSVVVCGHPQIEMALVELSRETGDDRYARLAKAFIDRRGRGFLGEGRFGATYYQDRVPYRAMSNVEGHAVRALYLGCGAVDVATEFGDIELLQAAKRQWTNMVASKTYLTGGVGSRHWGESFGDDFELPSDRAYCETCAAIGVVMWSWRLLLAEPDARLADLIERALFNGMLAGVSLDGSRYHYVNPLRVRGSHPRQPWFEIACCPPNLMRTLATLDHYVASRDDLGVYVHQFTSADIDAGGTRQLHMETTYPSGDVVRLVVDTDADRPWTLRLRIPSWAGEGFALSLNGQPATGIIISGYLELTRQWNAGDALELTLPMAPRLTRAVTSVENLQGQAAIERGPLVFCVEQCDLPVDLHPDDLVVVAGGELKDVDATVAEVPGVHVRGGLARRDRHVWPFPGHGEQTVECVAAAVEAVAVPYFAWGNRAVGAMRVWVRTHDEMGEMA
jgi:DUF1680 family protein